MTGIEFIGKATFAFEDPDSAEARLYMDTARRMAARRLTYERDFLKKHAHIARSLVQLVEDPDREAPSVKDAGDLLVKGLEQVRETAR